MVAKEPLSRRAFARRLGSAAVAAAVGTVVETATGAPAQAPATGAAASTTPSAVAQVRLRGRTGLWNVAFANGRISDITQAPVSGPAVIAGNGGLLTEGLVDHHIHLDKTLTADRVKWDRASVAADRQLFERERAAGRFIRGFTAFRESQIKASFTEEDVYERAMRLARMASANGTVAMRSHCVVEAVRELKCVRGLLKAKADMRPYMDLQVNLHPQDGPLLTEPNVIDLIRRGLKLGADGVGGLPELDPDHADEYVDLVFRLAAEGGAFIDMHVDQPRDPKIFSHPVIVAKTRKFGMQGRVTASHSYSLDVQPRERVLPVLDDMAKEGVHLACTPYSSLEMRITIPRTKGVLVSIMNDNVRDTWTRGGKADLVEQASIYCRGANVGSSDEQLDEVFDLITTCPGKATGLKDYGLRVGGQADLVLFEASSTADVLLQQAPRAFVFKAGRVVAADERALW